MKTLKIAALFVTLFITPAWLLAGNQDQKQTEDKNQTELQQPTEQQLQPETQHVGSILESITEGKYIYLKLDDMGEKIWIATYPAFLGGEVAVGDQVQYAGGVEMTGFESEALDKTFDRILFITKIKKVDAPQLKDFEHVPADNYHSQYVKQGKKDEISIPARGEVEKAENGKNIEEIFTDAEKLKDSEVIVRAKVMKISKNILGKNWLTLQDGTGNPPDNKLSATTLETANMGDIVSIKGTLKTNVTLGAGYVYRVLIEDATIIK